MNLAPSEQDMEQIQNSMLRKDKFFLKDIFMYFFYKESQVKSSSF